MALTLTEALAEIKTIGKRVEKKREFVLEYLARMECVKDPLEADGGSALAIVQQRQSVVDLENRLVALRRGIQLANEATILTIGGTSRSLADWLVWRREAAPIHRAFLDQIRTKLSALRERAKRDGVAMTANASEAERRNDIIVNLNEMELAKEIENLEDILGQLDGQLSLKNATVLIDE